MPVQAFHRKGDFELCLERARGLLKEAYGDCKRHKVDMPVFITDIMAVYGNPPIKQALWSTLFIADALGRLAKNNITQARALSRIHPYKERRNACTDDPTSASR